MTRYILGINTCFAVKRWPEPDTWAEIVRGLGVSLVQHSFDLVQLDSSPELRRMQAMDVRTACQHHGLTLDSTFTGLAAYSSNMMLDPNPDLRRHAERWVRRAIAFTADVGATSTGGHIGAFSVGDWRDPARREALEAEIRGRLRRLAAHARRAGLQSLLVENLAAAREPSTMAGVDRLLTEGDERHVPVRLCLDVGHQCVPGTSGEDRDPYAWLRRMGSKAAMVQLQQSNASGDHHWPFTPARNAEGRIEAPRVLDALDQSGAEEMPLFIEVIPPFEQDDEEVIDDLQATVAYWQDALARARG